MKLTKTQELIVSVINKAEYMATRAIARATGLSPVCVRNNAHILIKEGLVEAASQAKKLSPLKIKLVDEASKKPNFDKLLFSTKWS